MEQTMLEMLISANERMADLRSKNKELMSKMQALDDERNEQASAYYRSREEFDDSVMEYWAVNGSLIGSCFKADLEANDWSGRMGDATHTFFKILGAGKRDGNNRPIVLAEWFEVNNQNKHPIGYRCDWFYVPPRLMSPTNMISEKEYNDSKSTFKLSWQKELEHIVGVVKDSKNDRS